MNTSYTKLQQLEVENSRLRSNLATLQIAAADGSESQDLLKQYNVLCVELDRQRDECVQLHSILAKQTQGFKNVASNNYGSHIDLNEDGELVEAQKKIDRQLEDESDEVKNKWDSVHAELKKIKEENENQRKILLANVNKSPQSHTEAFMQYEIIRQTNENWDLQVNLDAMIEKCKQLKKQNKILLKKLRDAGVIDELEVVKENTLVPIDKDVSSNKDQRNYNIPVGRKKVCEFQGMFEYSTGDVQLIARCLIYDLKPQIAVTLLPGLPAYILFMCIRHTDLINDYEKVKALINTTTDMIKKVTTIRHDDLETTVLWLSNTLRLHYNLKQYSGDKIFQAENTPKQNNQYLRNFDLSEYTQVLSDIAVGIYQGVIKHLKGKVSNIIVPAILEPPKPSSKRGRSRSLGESTKGRVDAKIALNALLQKLSNVHKILCHHGVDPKLILQIFRQLFYFICATSLNYLLLRKDLCHWSEGVQIQYNLSDLEQWCREHQLQDTSVLDTLQPLIQAAQLLIARKTDKDVQSICDMCDKLSVVQIITLLNIYTPADKFEECVPVNFIRKVQQKLKDRNESEDQQLLMDIKFSFSVRFPFNPSNIRLEDIEIPEILNLPMLKKV